MVASVMKKHRLKLLEVAYMVSLTSESEDTWVYESLPAYDRWIGGVQDVNAPDYAEPAGGWGMVEWRGHGVHELEWQWT